MDNPKQPEPRRRRSYIIPKRTFLQRYPKSVVLVGTVGGILIFFSRTIYDAFIRTDFAPVPADPDKRREAILQAWKV